MAHWRDHLNSSLIGAYTLYDDKTDGFKEVDGFIIRTCHEKHNLGASGFKDCFVAYTSLDDKKPMKINVTIANAISNAAGTRNPDKWVNIPVTFFVDQNVNSKEGKVEAIRCRKNNKVVVDYSLQIAKLRACTTIEELGKAWIECGNIAIASVKDEMKAKLTAK